MSAAPSTDPHDSTMASWNCAYRAPNPQRVADHRRIPDDRRRIGEEKSPVAVQNTKAPRGEDKQPGAGKEDAHNPDRQFALVAAEAGRDPVDQVRSRQHTHKDKNRSAERKQRGQRPRRCVTLCSSSSRASRAAYTGIKEAERTPSPNRFCSTLGIRKAALKASAASGIPEIVRKERTVAYKSGDAAQENPGGDEKRRSLRCESAGNRCVGGTHEQVLQIEFMVSL